MKTKQTLLPVMAGIAALAAMTSTTRAQSSDALLDKLVDKGILTVQEANDLKEEADKGYSQAYQVKSGMPDWVSSFKINGDMRGRYESFRSDNQAFVPRDRFRYRLRVGGIATFKENFEVGFRFSSSEAANGGSGGDPISGNTTLTSNGSKKLLYIDLAYGKWTAWNGPSGSEILTFGKMENPFVFSDMVFDADYTPEGFASQTVFNINDKHAIKANAGGFAVREIGGDSQDAYLVGAQLRFDSDWSTKLKTSFGLAQLALTDTASLSANAAGTTENVPNQNAGNIRGGTGSGPSSSYDLFNSYYPIVADGALTYTLESFPMYSGAFPIRVFGEYMENPGADNQNQAYQVGVTFGKSGKKGLWDVTYRFKELQGDAWYEEFVDSDFGAYYAGAPAAGLSSRVKGAAAPNGIGYAAGTNIRGHIIKATYSPYNCLTLGLTAFLTEVIDTSFNTPAAGLDKTTDMVRIQADAVWKF